MNKKFVAIFGILILAVSVSAVSAFGLGDITGGSSDAQKVTIDNFEFPIPSDYKEDGSYDVVDERTAQGGLEYTYCQKAFKNAAGQYVSILVGDYGDFDITDSTIAALGGEKTTFNGVDGYLSNEGNISTFSYAKDKKLVVIAAENEKDIEGFVAK